VIGELERIWKDLIMTLLRHYTGIFLEWLRNITENRVRIASVLAKIRTKYFLIVTATPQEEIYNSYSVTQRQWPLQLTGVTPAKNE
jgi:hypothetical protein